MNNTKKIAVGGVIGVLLATLTGCSAPAFALFEEAATACGGNGITVADKGETLTVDMMGETDYSGASLSSVECVFNNLNIPAYVKDNIYNTNSLAGRQSATFDLEDGSVIEVSWSYHPDNGLDAVFHKTDGE